MRRILGIIIILTAIFAIALHYNKNVNIKDSSKTVTFWTLQLGTYDKYINNIISEYEKNHPETKIKWIDVPYAEGEKRTLAAILSDNPPDLVNLTPDFSLLLAQKKALYLIDEKKLVQFLPSLLNTLKYNDKYFGVPFYATSAVTLCNMKLSDESPKTYDELFNINVPKNSNLTMISFTENDTLLKLLNKYNINTPAAINDEKSVNIFKTLKKLYDENLFPKESVTQTHRDALEKYMSGKLAFLVTGANFLNMIKENAPDVYKNTKVIPQLTGETGLYDYSLMNFIIPLKSKNKEEALDFALFFTNKQNQLELSKITTILPVNKYALNDDYFIYSSSDIQSKARTISAKQLYSLQPPIQNIKNKKELNTLSSDCIQEILINNIPIQKALDKFSQEWEKL